RGLSSVERPKRPMTAYIRFVKDYRSEFKQKNPEADSRELVKKLAGAWNELPASQKQVYEEAEKTDRQRYRNQLAVYKAQLTHAQATAWEEEKKKQRAKRKSLKAKKELIALGKPKRPRSSFNMFMSEHFQESEGISAVAKLKQLLNAWQKMSTLQKQPYLQLAEDDKIRYANEIKLWEARMLELGRNDLVRSKNIKKKIKSEE
ncbi:TFAM factor, partial [Rhinopomastus cyanomelas]|nr:TFAM factor [Rhinopomastus cyanomelas]